MHMFSIIWGTIGLSWLCSSEVQIGSDRWIGASLHHLVSLRALECTRPTSLHQGIPGWRRNTGANDSPGDSKEECCTATCQAYHYDLKEGWTSNPDRSHFLASDAETCCLQTCSRHKCSENWVPKAKQDKAGETDLECCDKTCQLHFCDESAGWKTNVRAASVAANDDISCCTSTCKRHSCGPGWVLDQAKFDEAGG